ncbi:hypothetical protein EYE40_10045 [Glaciihabitans arcticus]|uniref:Uncharacterized protein n=1 Tax=Glaciihabitans arcticus TaxID=2668039 RepID=A0A4Q9GSQ4_9MICO|nr:hypothetical protein [Glaciihabitans arcticus]TBN57701.1 hypothetical protein EYE40_10045 [Glaciihabitans arcticus]
MTSAQPPLVVHIDRAKAAKLRKRERTVRYVGGAVQILFGLLFLGVIASFVIPSIDVVNLGSIVLSFGFAVVISVALIALGIASFVYVAKKDDAYWSAENLPLTAFTVHENGLTLPDLDGGGSFEIPWEWVKGDEREVRDDPVPSGPRRTAGEVLRPVRVRTHNARPGAADDQHSDAGAQRRTGVVTEYLEVRVDKAKIARWRTSERRSKRVSAYLSIALGLLLVGSSAVFAIYFAQNAPESVQWVYVLFALEFVAGLYQFWVARREFRAIAAKAAYWDSDDLPDVAFRLDTAGIELRDPADAHPILVPWAAVRGLRANALMLTFSVERGMLPARYRNRIQFGLAVLDTPLHTIRAASRDLSGGTVG